MKKTLSSILAILMLLFSIFVIPVNAEEAGDVDYSYPETEINVPYKDATIDGVVSDGEWDGATELTLNISDTTNWEGQGAGIFPSSERDVAQSHTDEDFTNTIKLMYKDGYLYYLEVRTDSTPYYTSQDERMPYCQDGTLAWFYNNKTRARHSMSVFAESDGNGSYILFNEEDSQTTGAKLDCEMVSKLNDKGFVIEAKIDVTKLKLTEKDLALGYIQFTYCSVNIYNPEFSGSNKDLWEGYGYQGQYIGVNNWTMSPDVVLTGKTYDYVEETKAPFTTKPPVTTETPTTAAPATNDPAVTTNNTVDEPADTEEPGFPWAIVAVAAAVIVVIAVVIIVVKKKK